MKLESIGARVANARQRRLEHRYTDILPAIKELLVVELTHLIIFDSII